MGRRAGGRNIQDLNGQTFNRLTVEGRAPQKSYIGNATWRCRCICGTLVDVIGYKLKTGATKSCGCLRKQRTGDTHRTHGMCNSREYHAWCAAKKRCTDPNCVSYAAYGGRGIAMCAKWSASFESFLNDVGRAPTQTHSIDRINSDGDYEPGNVRWATAWQQATNKRATRLIDYAGRSMTIAEWERHLRVPVGRIKRRLASGWPVDRAMAGH